MIEVPAYRGPAYRVHDPRWAFMPTSGAGAMEHGGRLNRIGVSALYLALDEATALAEYKQLSALVPPGLMVSYELDISRIVDFSQGYSSGRDSLWQELFCDWRKLWFNQRVEPPSWLIGDMVLASGARGIMFPSMVRPEGINLVLFTDQLIDEDRLSVFDPDHQLPHDSSSWR